MKEITINSFEELHNQFNNYKSNSLWLFRGQGNEKWGLVPKAGREPYNKMNDKQYFEAWRRRAIEYIGKENYTDWEWLALAQHHGLATRLLDWSINPLVAAYFSVSNDYECDGAIFAFKTESDLCLKN